MSATTRTRGLVTLTSLSASSSSYGWVTTVHAAGLEIPRHVGPDQPQLPWCGGRLGAAARGHQVETQSVIGPRRTAVGGGEPQRKPTSDQDLRDLGQGQNLCHQIAHHLFPDLLSNQYAEIAPKVQEICSRYGLSYTSGSLHRQVDPAWKQVTKLSLPNDFSIPNTAKRVLRRRPPSEGGAAAQKRFG